MNEIKLKIKKLLNAATMKAGFSDVVVDIKDSTNTSFGDYQSNFAMTLAKLNGLNPNHIAETIIKNIPSNDVIEKINVAGPGFINITIKNIVLEKYLQKISKKQTLNIELVKNPKNIIIDYCGVNVAKEIHVGHLRSAIIGEAIKRISKIRGNNVLGDIHMGDWGLQMGLVINGIKKLMPNLPYFDETFTQEYPKFSPVSVKDLNYIYPTESAIYKSDEKLFDEALKVLNDKKNEIKTHTYCAQACRNKSFIYKNKNILPALCVMLNQNIEDIIKVCKPKLDNLLSVNDCRVKLQNKQRGYYNLWQKIMQVSKADIKDCYDKLGVNFDLWLGESDTQDNLGPMIKFLLKSPSCKMSGGALIYKVAKKSDLKPFPPAILLASDGSALYAATDLATLEERVKKYRADEIYYVTDARQILHLEQVFRAAKKSGLIPKKVKLEHNWFGTMNGKDGKPFKTRDGGVLSLRSLIEDVMQAATEKIKQNGNIQNDEQALKIAVAALKFADLSNTRTKDYVFDVDKFASFEGKTGPYIQYTAVRIKSILDKAKFVSNNKDFIICNDKQREICLQLANFGEIITMCDEQKMPHLLCDFIYKVCLNFNSFYSQINIINEKDKIKKQNLLEFCNLTYQTITLAFNLLSIEIPNKM